MSLQVELLEQSFNHIKPYGNLFVSNFYENLFKAHPETQSLFTATDRETRENHLWQDLVLIVENLRQPNILNNILLGLGARLYTYGASSEHYPLVRDTLFSTFKQFLGGEWTAEFEQAWQAAYVSFSELMLDGAEKTRKQMASINSVGELEATLKEEATQEDEVAMVADPDKSLVEDFSPTFVAEEKTEAVASTDNILLEEFLPTTGAKSEQTLEEKTEAVASTDNILLEEFLLTTGAKSEQNLEEKTEAVVSNDDSLTEDIWSTPSSDLEETQEEETEALADIDNISLEDLLNTPVADLEETRKEETEAVASMNNALTEDLLNTPVSESADIVEEEVTIVESTDNSSEKTTMSESDNNLPQKDIELDQSDDFLAEDIVENPLADLSEKQKSPAIDPHFTQIYSPESQSASSATATAVKPVASEQNYQPESKPSQSKKGLLIGGGVAGGIGLLLLLLL